MHIKRNVIVMFVALMFVVSAICGIYFYMYYRVDLHTLEYIRSLQKGPNNFSDLAGDIGVTSIDDLGYKINGEYDITIWYGKQVIKINKNCLKSDAWKTKAKQIGIEVLFHVNEDDPHDIEYKVLYWGNPLEEWSKVTGN